LMDDKLNIVEKKKRRGKKGKKNVEF